jgi:uncharacterized protein (TIGR02145 family)
VINSFWFKVKIEDCMKNLISTFFCMIYGFHFLISQAPNLMSYQAVIWDANGNLVSEKMVSIKLSILQGSVSGISVYSENHRVQTNINGLVSLMIGGGTNATGKISDINWGGGSFFLKTETDPTGGVNFSITGTTQLVSVPYSIHSNSSNLSNNLNTPLPGLKGQILSVDKDGKPIWVSTIPTVSTTNYSTISADSAKGGGNVTSDGGSPVTARGVVWSTSPNPTISLSTKTIDGSGLGTFSSIISGLTSITDSTSYYVRAYATNINGTAYGEEISLIFFNKLPKFGSSIGLSWNCYEIYFSVYDLMDGGSPILSKGCVWSTRPNPDISLPSKTNEGPGKGGFTSVINIPLSHDSLFIRSYAKNSNGTGYGKEVAYNISIPNISTTPSTISYTYLVSGGNIWDVNLHTCRLKARGVVWSQSEVPTISLPTRTVNGSDYGTFKSYIYDLKPNTTYYLRAYGTYNDTTIYGNIDTVRTRTWVNCPSTIKDIDNNIYNVVTIGFQCWTKENLKVSRYRNGEIIPVVTQDKAWESLTSGSRCWYANDSTKYEEPYGNLYNGFAVSDSRGLCPSGWHVPRDDEWSNLTDFLGGNTVAGEKMRANVNGTSSISGFSGLPGGLRSLANKGGFIGLNILYIWWSSSYEGSITDNQVNLGLQGSSREVYWNIYGRRKENGFSVRCLRD